MINCNCFNDWDHSLLVLNRVLDSYFTLWMNCYFSMRNYMPIYVVVLKMTMMPSCLYYFLSTPLSLNMWTYLSILAFAWGQARSKLGGVDTSIMHHEFLLIFMLFLFIIPYFDTILMPFLSEYARYITRREISGNWNSGPENQENGRKFTGLQMTWNFMENFYANICCCSKDNHDAFMSAFYFIDTSISKHVDIFIDFGFRLRTSEV